MFVHSTSFSPTKFYEYVPVIVRNAVNALAQDIFTFSNVLKSGDIRSFRAHVMSRPALPSLILTIVAAATVVAFVIYKNYHAKPNTLLPISIPPNSGASSLNSEKSKSEPTSISSPNNSPKKEHSRNGDLENKESSSVGPIKPDVAKSEPRCFGSLLSPTFNVLDHTPKLSTEYILDMNQLGGYAKMFSSLMPSNSFTDLFSDLVVQPAHMPAAIAHGELQDGRKIVAICLQATISADLVNEGLQACDNSLLSAVIQNIEQKDKAGNTLNHVVSIFFQKDLNDPNCWGSKCGGIPGSFLFEGDFDPYAEDLASGENREAFQQLQALIRGESIIYDEGCTFQLYGLPFLQTTSTEQPFEGFQELLPSQFKRFHTIAPELVQSLRPQRQENLPAWDVCINPNDMPASIAHGKLEDGRKILALCVRVTKTGESYEGLGKIKLKLQNLYPKRVFTYAEGEILCLKDLTTYDEASKTLTIHTVLIFVQQAVDSSTWKIAEPFASELSNPFFKGEFNPEAEDIATGPDKEAYENLQKFISREPVVYENWEFKFYFPPHSWGPGYFKELRDRTVQNNAF